MTMPTLGKVVDRLEEKRWVERRDDPEDRRVNRVFLTKQATLLIPQVELLVDEIVDITLSGMHKANRDTLVALLEAVHSNLVAATEQNNDAG